MFDVLLFLHVWLCHVSLWTTFKQDALEVFVSNSKKTTFGFFRVIVSIFLFFIYLFKELTSPVFPAHLFGFLPLCVWWKSVRLVHILGWHHLDS